MDMPKFLHDPFPAFLTGRVANSSELLRPTSSQKQKKLLPVVNKQRAWTTQSYIFLNLNFSFGNCNIKQSCFMNGKPEKE